MTDKDLGTLCVCAVRYALPRRTYVGPDVARIVAEQWQRLSDGDRVVIRRDIRDAIKAGNAGDPVLDTPAWQAVLELTAAEREVGG